MDIQNAPNLEALERTAAWVSEVSAMKGVLDEDSPVPGSADDHTSESDMEKHQFNSLCHKLQDEFTASLNSEIDIPKTVKEFKEMLEKFGISQRFAAKYIMEKTSQGNLSFLLDKGRHKHWQELSPRGRVPYVRMRHWLDSNEEQKQTVDLLQKAKEHKKSGPKDGGGRREKFSLFQLMVLCRFYEEDPNPNLSTRALLAEKLGAPVDRVTIWFQNQRARGFPARKMLSQSNFVGKSQVKKVSNDVKAAIPSAHNMSASNLSASDSELCSSQSNYLLNALNQYSPGFDQSENSSHSMKNEQRHNEPQMFNNLPVFPSTFHQLHYNNGYFSPETARILHSNSSPAHRPSLSSSPSNSGSQPATAHTNNRSHDSRTLLSETEKHSHNDVGYHGNGSRMKSNTEFSDTVAMETSMRVKAEPCDSDCEEPLNFSTRPKESEAV